MAPGTAEPEPSGSFNRSGLAWESFAARHLQTAYSRALYGAPGLVDPEALQVVWTPLLSPAALSDLRASVCLWEPGSVGGVDLPLHAPYSLVANPLAIWRFVPAPAPIPSHTFVEVTHSARGSDTAAFPWFYVASGSGVSLNVGRTFVSNQSEGRRWCKRGKNPSRKMDLLLNFRCLFPRSLVQNGSGFHNFIRGIDTIQLLHAWDPTDSVSWTHGFRHELLLLSSEFLSEAQPLPPASTHVLLGLGGYV